MIDSIIALYEIDGRLFATSRDMRLEHGAHNGADYTAPQHN